MINQTCKPKMALTIVLLATMGFCNMVLSQTPTVTVRLANPAYTCSNGQYCLDVEFKADTLDVELFGMNVRFFYPDNIMELDGFTDFQGGYGPVSPDPPTVLQSAPGFGTTFFGFPAPGVADFVNGAIQLVDDMGPGIILDTVNWTKLFQICFIVEGGPNFDSTNFCPPIVWDLELDPANGGYLTGDDGVVMTIVEPPPTMSSPSFENVVQYNWMYTGDGSAPPYGEPVETSCISLECIPTIACPADVTIECFESIDPQNTGQATAIEVCSSPITISYSDVTVSNQQGCLQAYSITRTWIAVNECNISDTCLQIITVEDNFGPVVTCPADITIECDESTAPANTGFAIAIDACDPTPEVSYIDITVAGLCPQEYTIDRIWTATDSCGNVNITLCRQEIKIQDTTPPVIVCPTDLTLECTDPIPADDATATDNCSSIITYDYTDIMCDNPVMGFNGLYDFSNWTILTPSGGSVTPMGDMQVMFESPDGNIPCPTGASVLLQIVIPSTGQLVFDWDYTSLDVDGPFFDPFGYNLNGTFYQLTDDNGPLMQSGVATVAVTAGDIFAFEQNSIDCILGEGATTVVEFFACVTQMEPICSQLIIRAHTAADECGNESNCIQTIYIVDTTPPTITCAAQTTPINCPATPVFVAPTATDACDATVSITFSDMTSQGSCAGTYSTTRTWTATDNCGNTSTCSRTIVVQDVTPPTITCVAQTTPINCPATPVFTPPTATDACDATVSITFSDATTAGSCAGTYSTTRTWTATDDCGNSSTCSRTIVVQDITPPTITCVAQTTPINCPATPVFTPPTATDACDATVSITFSDVTTAGSCAGTYSTTRTWTATDDCGNSATCSRTIVVQDITPPTITCVAQTTPINCPATPVFTPPTATDACDATVSITFSDVTTTGSCAGTYSTTRTWTATDDCGNSATCSRTIVVQDITPPTITCVAQTTPINCPATPVFTPPTATDACDATVSITFSDVTAAGSCAGTYSTTRTWTATDDCGNSATCSRTIVVRDITPPTITCATQTTPINCPATPVFTPPTATDACDATVSITFSDVTTAGSCAGTYSTTRTWTATDDCGNNATCSRTIVVQDITPPTITCATQTTPINCPSTPVFTPPTATDACDLSVDVTFSDVTTPGSCTGTYSTTRTWTATDDCANSATCSRTIVVQDITPPVIVCPADVTIECDEDSSTESNGFASATDECNSVISINSNDVTIEGGCPQEYTILRTWTAVDECGNSSTCLQTIFVDDSTPPVIVCPVDVTLACTDPVPTDVATATDNCGSVTVSYEDIMCDNPVMGFNGIYDFSNWTTIIPPEGGSVSTMSDMEVMLVSPDITLSCDDAAVQFSIIIPSTGQIVFDWHYATNDVDGPSFDPFGYNLNGTFYQLTDDNGNDIQSGTATVAVTAGDVFAFEQQSSDCVLGAGATTVVEFFACIEEDAEICTMLIIRTHTAADECGNAAICVQTIYVVDSIAPVITCPIDITIECDESTLPPATGTASATDDCDTDIEIGFNDVIIGSQVCVQEYTIQRTWTATDNCGNSSTCLQLILVDDSTPPVITCPGDVTIECTDDTSTESNGFATATDNCSMVVNVTWDDVTIEGGCPQEYTITRTFTAQDECGNSSTCAQTIVIDDSTPPVVTCPADVTIECTGSTDPETNGFASAIDNCGQPPAVDYSDVTINDSCPEIIERTWTATDECGNIGTCVQTISIVDVTPPMIICPQGVTVSCASEVPPVLTGGVTVSDNCGFVTVTHGGDIITNMTCANRFNISRIYVATDVCGNTATCAQSIVVFDNTPPIITCVAQTTPINCPATPVFTPPTATDNCSGTVAITFSDVISQGSCAGTYSTTRTWTATDVCGNSASCSRTIVVQDVTPPTITCATQVTPINCPATPVFTPPTATDACDATVTITFSDVTNQGSCAGTYSTTRTWTATDDCGNSATCSRTIVVQDITPPTITCATQVTPINCPATPVFVPPTATDACDATVVITFSDVTIQGTCTGTYSTTRTWTATDDCGNSATCSRTIVVRDITPPTITCATQVSPINCPATPVFVPPTATDACDATVAITFSDATIPGSCIGAFSRIRTWTATDDCGNTATCSRTIVSQDITPPTITCPSNITIAFGANENPPATGVPTGTDLCSGTPTFTFTNVIIPGICSQEYVINRTWKATDGCGNMATCLQVITVDGPCILDLSLTKVLIDAGPVEGGDDVNFVISVTNEGELSVGSLTVTDYIPVGFMLNDPDWIPGIQGSTGQSASKVFSIANGGLDANGLNPGETMVVVITLRANANIQPGCYFNIAEISAVFDVNGVNITTLDIDSDPDPIDTNDPPGEDDIDNAQICVLPRPEIAGDGYVCPGETTIYSVLDYNPNFTYTWSLNGGGNIIQDNGSDIEVQWQDNPGGPFQITLTVTLCNGCQATTYLFVYIQGVEELTCNDHVQISLGPDCEAIVLSGMILEGENEGNNNYFVVITDQNGNVIPNATLTYEHIGQTFTVSVQNECNDQSCWGTITVEDKIPPVIECADVTLSCGTSLEPVYAPPVTGSEYESVNSGLPIGPNGGTVTTQELILDVPSNAVVTDVNVTVDLNHSWVGDLTVELVSPAGTTVLLVNQLCGAVDNWDNVTFDDQAGLQVTTACNPIPPALSGSLIPQGSLSAINGQAAVGVWKLVITDQAFGDAGILNTVALDVDYYLAAPNAPIASDACGEVNLTYTEIESGEDCANVILTRYWTATDGSGNTATCVQTITITPLTLDNIEFPSAYEGQCGESILPGHTGWPTVDGQPITDQNNVCNIYVGYWDKELNECGGGRKIVRTWTVLDWCTVEIVEAVQVIKLRDSEGPVLTCPADLQVGTDFWYCYANVSVPKPQAYDDCSEIESYSLSSSSGLVVSLGSNYVINELGLGTHTVTWTVTDECGNSTSCSFHITVVDDVVPVALCDQHTIVSLTNDGPKGVTLIPADVFDDGSYDNCGPVTFQVRRMTHCIDFDWTTEGACNDDEPDGQINSRDWGTVLRDCAVFSCCDIVDEDGIPGTDPIMVELEVEDAAGNKNYCMVEVIVQDKIAPFVECPPDVIVSCDFWFNVQEGTFVDGEGNNNGALDEDPLSAVFGSMYDAFRYDEGVRNNIIINDPGNEEYNQPYNWGLDGWADDNCIVALQVKVTVTNDCSGDALPGNAPDGAVKLIERKFGANDGNTSKFCTQKIWVVDFDPFYITDNTCTNSNQNDGVKWPCDVLLTTCPEDLGNTGEPIIYDDACSLIGVTYEDQRFDFVDGACFKILRDWAVIDWCQYNPQTGEGLWHYTQVIKVHDKDGPEFVAPCENVVLCVADEGVSLPDNNQAFLGENNPLASSCSVHLNLSRTVHETCSGDVKYDVKIYPFNGTDYILLKPTTTVSVNENNDAVLSFDTRQNSIKAIREDGLPYNSQWCGDYHRILWSVEDGCGNWSHCEYLIRLEDCKQPSPVCINGLSTVVMPIGGQVTVWAKDFNASSFDDCTPAAELLYSFSGDVYQPSYTYTCDNVPAFNVELTTQVWVADGGTDDNCNGQISWIERNKDFCTTTIVITDNAHVCDTTGGSILAGDILTEQTDAVAQVNVTLTSPGHFFPQYVTTQDGKFFFDAVPYGSDYMITPDRNDQHRNGVSTIDLVRIQKHLLGKELFTTPYQYIAADANNTQSISAIDLIEIRKLILGIYTEFPLNKSWRFVEKGFPMAVDNPWPFNENIQISGLATDSMMHNDFVAVKIGDVNNTAKANANQIQPRNGRRVLHVTVEGPSKVETGNIVDVKLVIPESVEGLQWTLETEGLTFEGVSSETMNINDSHIGVLKNGVITMSWNTEGEQSVVPGQVVMLRFIATASGNMEDMIQLTSRVTEAEAYTPEGEILDVKLGHANTVAEFALYQNNPNPWNAQTMIGFDLPSDASVTFTVFDVTGKAVKTIVGEYKSGYNTITLSVQDLPSTGVMYYRLESGAYSASKKMVLLK